MFYLEITRIANELNAVQRALFWKPLRDEAFRTGYGSSTVTKHHHSYAGGLYDHTVEVILLTDILAKVHGCWSPELLIAAAWHDFGKIYDYDSEGVKIPGRDKTSHIEDSVQNFLSVSCISGWSYDQDIIMNMIKAHHGKLEWGSLKVPVTAGEKVLHMADYISYITNDLDLNLLHTGNRK